MQGERWHEQRRPNNHDSSEFPFWAFLSCHLESGVAITSDAAVTLTLFVCFAEQTP